MNAVRKRVGMPELQKTDASKPTYCGTQDDLRQRIRNEWRVEFALEGGKRQWDIRRWGIAKKVLNEPFLGLKYKLVKAFVLSIEAIFSTFALSTIFSC